MDDKICRIAVFYDGTYFNKVSNYYLYQHERGARLSIKGLHEFIVSEVARAEGRDARVCRIVDASYFRGRLTAQQAFDQDRLMSERLFEDVLMRADVAMFQEHVSTRPDGTLEEKRIDVWLALEAYEMASLKRYDVCVLLTGDGDFVPLVHKLNTLGSRVMLMGWSFEYERDGRTHRTQVSAALADRVNYPLAMERLIDARERGADPRIDNLFLPRAGDAPPAGPAPAAARADPAEPEARTGVVVNLPPDRKYGFIKPDGGGENVFFHATDVDDAAFAELQLQDRVAFGLVQGERSPVARNVRAIS